MSHIEQQFCDYFAKAELIGADLPWLAEAREHAIEQFRTQGLPTRRDEDWKYTSLYQLSQTAFEFGTGQDTYLTQEDINAIALGIDAHRVVFINGHFQAALSTLETLESGLTITPIVNALNHHADLIKSVFKQETQDSLNALNLALFNDGVLIHVDSHQTIQKPIEVIYISDRANNSHHLRNIVLLEAHARAQVVMHSVSLTDEAYFCDLRQHLITKEHAHLDYIMCHEEGAQGNHISDTVIEQSEASHVSASTFALSGKLLRSDIHNTLNAEHVHCDLNGLYIAKGEDHIDHHTQLLHAKPNGSSREFYKGIITDKARAVFNGKIEVAIDAQHTDAQLTNNNLLLSKEAEIDTKPELEIYADDVKCAHGATVGQLDEDELFYLRARGIDSKQAKQLLLHAFANEIVERIDDETIAQAILKRIEKSLARISE